MTREAGKTVLVTGARGYLGGRLVVDMAARGWSVIGTSRGHLLPPQGWPDVPLVGLDPLQQDEDDIVAMLRQVDSVVHLAAPNEILSTRDPVAAQMSGGVGGLKLLRAATKAGCRRFVFLSTIHVYGAPLCGRIVETDLPKPMHPYAINHRAMEDYVLLAQAKGDIEAMVLRLSNGIGAPAWGDVDRWTTVGNDLCRQAVETGRVVLHSSGRQWRDFIVLCDFVAAIRHVLTMERDKIGEGLFNLGGQLPLRMIDVALAVSRRAEVMLDHPVPVTHGAVTGEDPSPIAYCIDRIAATGFTPSPASRLDDEIDATLALCRTAFERRIPS